MDDVMVGRAAIRRWFDRAIAAVEPGPVVRDVLRLDDGLLRAGDSAIPLPESGRVVVVAVGKAAAGMAQGAANVLGDRIDTGIILTKYGHLRQPTPGFTVFEAGHPLPDENSVRATGAILDAVGGLTSNDIVLALISGGGSALLERPVEGVSLEDMQTTTRALMHAGAGIHDLNAVRKALSTVKGGGLRRVIGPARCVTLLLSDVMGNDPSVIASGPTVVSPGQREMALQVVERAGVRDDLPQSVLNAISRDPAPRDEVDTSRDIVFVAADNATFVREIVRSAENDGLTVLHEPVPYDGDATKLGRGLVRMADEAPDEVDVIVRGGESTVSVTGSGTGGRNTEMALVAALEMRGQDEWLVASLASDGDDGNSGAAGAIADGQTVGRAEAASVDPAEALAENDSATVFLTAGGIVETGPTGTNVNDVYIALRRRAVRDTRNTT